MDWRLLIIAAVFAIAAGVARLGWAMQRSEPAPPTSDPVRALKECQAELVRVRAVAESRGRVLLEMKRSRGERLATVAAALRDPLTTVCGFAEAALLPDAEPMTPRQTRAFAAVAEAGRRIRIRLDELTALSDLDTGATAVRLERLDPLHIVRDVCDAMGSDAHAAGITLHAPQAAAGFAVTADPALLARVLRAVIGNAIRCNRSEGAVLVEVRAGKDAWVRISVHDTSAGLDTAAAAQLFEPFETPEPGVVRRGEVSLAIARQTMIAMDGWIEAVGTPGEGLSVTLGLPAAAAPVEAPRGLPAGTLLYVDDDAVHLALMRHVIASLGDATLHVARDAPSARAMAQSLAPDAILVRDDRPDLDTLALVAALAADPQTAHVPVLALSTARSSARRQAHLLAGVTAWLELPLNIPQFHDALRKALTRRDARILAA